MFSSSSGSSTRSNTDIFATERFLTDFLDCDVSSRTHLFDEGVASGVLIPDTNSANLRDALSSMKGGTVCAMKLRKISMAHKDKQTHKRLNNVLRDYLQVCFSRDALEFRQVTFESSHGAMLERVAEKDSVLSRIRTLRELKRRLGNGRRCYALLHPQLPDDPVAFIHVALTQELAPGIQYLDRYCKQHLAPKCAMFYSVNSPHAALSGLDLASRIIKLAVADVAKDFPSIDTFSTLSPIPGFNGWLAKVAEGEIGGVKLPQEIVDDFADAAPSGAEADVLAHINNIVNTASEWHKDERVKLRLRPALEWLGRHYLTSQTDVRGSSIPYDPVARFHLRNGASLHRLNFLGNDSLIGLSRSSGLMVNYMYDMQHLQERALSFPKVHIHDAFHHISGHGEC